MTSKFIEGMLTKYQSDTGASVVNYSQTQHARMYPYVSMGAHQAGFPPAALGGYPNPLHSVGDTEKTCRYPGSVSMAEAMVNYSLGHHQNNATAASMATAANFYQAAAAASVASNDPSNPLNACSHAQSLGLAVQSSNPDIPRYPWMSITGITPLFLTLFCDPFVTNNLNSCIRMAFLETDPSITAHLICILLGLFSAIYLKLP